MKTRSRCTAIAAAIIALTFFASSAFAEYPDDAGHRGKGKHGGFYEELNLTPQQKEQIKENRAKNMERSKAVRENLRAKKAELKAEIETPAVDRAKISATTAEIKALTGQLIDQRVSGLLSMKEILTAEQFKKLGDKMGKKEKTGKRSSKHACR